MKFEPRPWQPPAIAHVLDVPRCNLWADPGMGKTGIVLSALDVLKITGSKFLPALVLGPVKVVRRVWSDEAAKWDEFAGLRVSNIVGTPAERAAALKRKADVYTINYENVQWLVEQCGSAWPFPTVIADESTRLKGFRLRGGTERAKALSMMVNRTGRWVNLTGTPSPNGLIDLWGQNWFVDGGQRLGRTIGDFRNRWFTENVYTHTWVPKDNAMDEITALLADVTMNIKAPLGLKPVLHNVRYIELPAKARAMYDEFDRELVAVLDGTKIIASTAADLSMKCLQIASGAIYTADGFAKVHDEKIDDLRSIFEEMAGKPLLVAYHFRHDLARITKAFPQARQLKTPKDEDAWNEGRIPMLLLHPQSAGHGLNLQYGGNTLAFFSHGWGLEEYMQVIERIGPMRQAQAGLDRQVIVHHIVARNTRDEEVLPRLDGKFSVQDEMRRRLSYGR